MVPLLIYGAKLEEKNAFATSVAVMFPLSLISLAIFFLRGGAWDDSAPWYALGGIAGGLLSANAFRRIPTRWLHRLFGLLLLYGGIRGVIIA